MRSLECFSSWAYFCFSWVNSCFRVFTWLLAAIARDCSVTWTLLKWPDDPWIYLVTCNWNDHLNCGFTLHVKPTMIYGYFLHLITSTSDRFLNFIFRILPSTLSSKKTASYAVNWHSYKGQRKTTNSLANSLESWFHISRRRIQVW